jgi:DNA polymerase
MSVDRRVAESLLAFWSEAGVDALYEPEARDRMAEPARATPRKATHVEIVRTAPVASGPAKELAWAADDLDALASAIAAFDGCPLKFQGARQAVCWRGEPTAPVMIVGEAPGGDEDLQGAPFVGRAGQLLDRMLAAGGLTGRVLITNTVFWRPPGNRTPSPEEQIACRPFLERAIELVRPRLLLLVGAAAAKSLLDRKEGILTLRGRWFEWRARHADLEIPALPTLHPAFLLRQPLAKKRAWQDLMMLAERLDRADRPD